MRSIPLHANWTDQCQALMRSIFQLRRELSLAEKYSDVQRISGQIANLNHAVSDISGLTVQDVVRIKPATIGL